MIVLILGRALQGIGGAAFCRWRNRFSPMRSRRANAATTQAYMGSVWVTAGLGRSDHRRHPG